MEFVRARGIGLDAGVGEVADELLDEERVALGLLIQRARELGRGGPPGAQPDQALRLGLGQPVDLELANQALVAQAGQR